ncbi:MULTISPECIES: LysR family transcriptional regulator [Halomonas]|uniref:LysR family transcriptional regulator n=1 Tax=Halomonas TaxID=2745 RepID=UPI001C9459BC|nr:MULTISPECIES: LysR family transcriptional regulator [Halomonas]MBY6207480.1 LysR family transcriptional regulator [Halomonas sp. DP3Y7-2]MBY6228289.1 LysR family transcriptional regulator [Halomonas sp. DP3Y7-1]MCA0916354.1 LysR family transcriptional regulator [Halomonas denitrificans]
MKKRASYTDLEVFLAVAKYGGVRKAALARDVTGSAVSHSLKNLEARLGIRLFHRFNNSLQLTEAGHRLCDQLMPNFERIDAALDGVTELNDAPQGRLRITALRDAMHVVLEDRISSFVERFPDVELDISLDDRFVAITQAGFDMGIRYRDRVPEGMAASPLTEELNWVVVGSPAYLEKAGRPRTPEDLLSHQCIRIRTGDGKLFSWELGNGADMVEVDVPGSVILGDSEASIALAQQGFGLFYCLEKRVANELASGQLEVVLPEWASSGPGFYAYYTVGQRVPHVLRVFLDHIKER